MPPKLKKKAGGATAKPVAAKAEANIKNDAELLDVPGPADGASEKKSVPKRTDSKIREKARAEAKNKMALNMCENQETSARCDVEDEEDEVWIELKRSGRNSWAAAKIAAEKAEALEIGRQRKAAGVKKNTSSPLSRKSSTSTARKFSSSQNQSEKSAAAAGANSAAIVRKRFSVIKESKLKTMDFNEKMARLADQQMTDAEEREEVAREELGDEEADVRQKLHRAEHSARPLDPTSPLKTSPKKPKQPAKASPSRMTSSVRVTQSSSMFNTPSPKGNNASSSAKQLKSPSKKGGVKSPRGAGKGTSSTSGSSSTNASAAPPPPASDPVEEDKAAEEEPQGNATTAEQSQVPAGDNTELVQSLRSNPSLAGPPRITTLDDDDAQHHHHQQHQDDGVEVQPSIAVDPSSDASTVGHPGDPTSPLRQSGTNLGASGRGDPEMSDLGKKVTLMIESDRERRRSLLQMLKESTDAAVAEEDRRREEAALEASRHPYGKVSKKSKKGSSQQLKEPDPFAIADHDTMEVATLKQQLIDLKHHKKRKPKKKVDPTGLEPLEVFEENVKIRREEQKEWEESQRVMEETRRVEIELQKQLELEQRARREKAELVEKLEKLEEFRAKRELHEEARRKRMFLLKDPDAFGQKNILEQIAAKERMEQEAERQRYEAILEHRRTQYKAGNMSLAASTALTQSKSPDALVATGSGAQSARSAAYERMQEEQKARYAKGFHPHQPHTARRKVPVDGKLEPLPSSKSTESGSHSNTGNAANSTTSDSDPPPTAPQGSGSRRQSAGPNAAEEGVVTAAGETSGTLSSRQEQEGDAATAGHGGASSKVRKPKLKKEHSGRRTDRFGEPAEGRASPTKSSMLLERSTHERLQSPKRDPVGLYSPPARPLEKGTGKKKRGASAAEAATEESNTEPAPLDLDNSTAAPDSEQKTEVEPAVCEAPPQGEDDQLPAKSEKSLRRKPVPPPPQKAKTTSNDASASRSPSKSSATKKAAPVAAPVPRPPPATKAAAATSSQKKSDSKPKKVTETKTSKPSRPAAPKSPPPRSESPGSTPPADYTPRHRKSEDGPAMGGIEADEDAVKNHSFDDRDIVGSRSSSPSSYGRSRSRSSGSAYSSRSNTSRRSSRDDAERGLQITEVDGGVPDNLEVPPQQGEVEEGAEADQRQKTPPPAVEAKPAAVPSVSMPILSRLRRSIDPFPRQLGRLLDSF